MKRLFLVFAFLVSTVGFSQRIMEGEMQLNAGVGFTSGWGTPFFIGGDYGILPDISVGAQLIYTSKTDTGYSIANEQRQYYTWKTTWFSFGGNANYHFNTLLNMPNNMDLYAGLTIAYNSYTYSYPSGLDKSYYSNYNPLGLGGQTGFRYFFSDKIAVGIEFGLGSTSGGKVGITYKL